MRALRRELTRIISELRLSIFDLRSEVHADIGLGSALSDYVRSVGTGSSLTVHLILDEAPSRLGIETETELMRIAQEAITNARRHAGAENLWVTCRVDPPRALLRIEDDGSGVKRATHTTASAWTSCGSELPASGPPCPFVIAPRVAPWWRSPSATGGMSAPTP